MRRKTLTGELWAEFVGTAVLILLSGGVVANCAYGTRPGPGGYDWTTIALGWAFAVVIAVYIAGGMTGAHISPAVTRAAIVRRTIDPTKGLMHMGALLVGAYVGAIVVHMLYHGSFLKDGYKNVFHTGPAPIRCANSRFAGHLWRRLLAGANHRPADRRLAGRAVLRLPDQAAPADHRGGRATAARRRRGLQAGLS